MANTPGTSNKGKEETRTTHQGHQGGHATHQGQGTQPGHQGQGAQHQGRGDEGMMGKAKDTATAVMDKAREAASSVAGTAGNVASAVGDKAEAAAGSVGSGMKSLAGTIRENAPREGMMGRAGSAVADGLEASGRYLEEEGLSGMMDDVTTFVRRNPLPALLLGIGLGFMLARMTRS